MARSSKGAAGARLRELDIVAPQESGAAASEEDQENLRELDDALGGSGAGPEEGTGATDDAGDGGGGEDPVVVDAGKEPEGPTPNPALVSVPGRPVRRPRRKTPEIMLRVDLELPEEIMNRARASVRKQFTGLERSKGMNFVFEAYVMAVDDLVGGAGRFDIHGVETVEDMAERVKIALAETLAVASESAA